MNKCLAVFLVVGCLTIWAVPNPAAGDVVTFRSASVPPTPFKQRLAQERGEVAKAEQGIELTGELLRPAGDGPFPALVMLHGCGRPSSTDAIRAERYVSWGYVVLHFDSFAPRGVKNECAGGATDRALDALGALDSLAHLSFVDRRRIAVVGFGQGGGAALDANNAANLSTNRFRAAVLYYPTSCPSGTQNLVAPVLVLIGELDDWTLVRSCRADLTTRGDKPPSTNLIVYPGAFHGFDSIELKERPKNSFGHHQEYNEPADLAARSAMRSFLMQALTR
jgi:dienelactone hydrolase